MAAAAVELADRYQRQGYMSLGRWGMVFMAFCSPLVAVWAATDGKVLSAVTFGAWTLFSAGHLAFNPATRPKSVARSREASRRIVAQGGQEAGLGPAGTRDLGTI